MNPFSNEGCEIGGFLDSWSMFLRIGSYKCNGIKLIGLGDRIASV